MHQYTKSTGKETIYKEPFSYTLIKGQTLQVKTKSQQTTINFACLIKNIYNLHQKTITSKFRLASYNTSTTNKAKMMKHNNYTTKITLIIVLTSLISSMACASDEPLQGPCG